MEQKKPNETNQSPIIYIMVIGFHHKKGCQLEFVYPETNLIKKQDSNNQSELYVLPKKWRHLPSLALPDGSHNYTSDYIYFHLENESATTTTQQKPIKPNKTIFGISCYRQINADELINKDIEVTRNTLQKSVCILSTCPLYASSVRFKLQAITRAYFEQKDFSKTQLLCDAFNSTLHINSTTLNDYSINSLNVLDNYMCLSLSDLVIRYQHKILVLFKLLLLQKKCLFQIKPVSNLSNTIISLISLIPDLLQSNKMGLDYCSGFFDSLDLVNCELERKAAKRQELLNAMPPPAPQSSLSLLSNAASLKHNLSTPQVTKRKKIKSSSVKHKKSSVSSSSTSSSASSSPSVSISSSPVSMTSSNFSSTDHNHNNQGLKKSNLLFDPTASSSSLINNLNQTSSSTTDDYSKINQNLQALQLNLDQQPKLNIFKKTESNNQLADLFKSKVSNVFKFGEWTSPTTPTTPQTPKLVKSSSSSHITRKSAMLQQQRSINYDEDRSIIDEEETSNNNNKKSINIEDLLKLDMGMPLKLFSQFNILHPYLSLYYLEYFTMINKMNTKLYCTTTLMMSMMSEANNNNNNNKSTDESIDDSIDFNSTSSSNNSSFNPYKQQQQQQTSYGYTIGATNILFKQRLYDDIDVFIDETTIDMKQNDSLKKQLQLTTADLRFADYIIKHVNNNTNQNNKSVNKSKTSSSIHNDNNNNNNSLNDTIFEGSDDWIRLNFKLYLYNLFASIVKEDLCNEIRNELEMEIIKLNNEETSSSPVHSSNSSTLSLSNNNNNNNNIKMKNNNHVIDIDDYIDKVVSTDPIAQPIAQTTLIENTKKKNRNYVKLRRKNTSSSHSLTNSSNLSSISNSYYSYDYTYIDYKDDYNSNYLNELKQTDSFKQWYDLNRTKLESSLFKDTTTTTTTTTAIDLNTSRLDYLLKRLQQLDDLSLGHPFNGQMGVNDIKLKFNFLITTTESGRKLNKAFMDTTKIVNSTGKAVGEVFSQAKSTFSSFFRQ